MPDINELKEKRFRFINKLYELTGGNKLEIQNMWDIGQILGFHKDETETITQYLEGEYLLESSAQGGGIAITHFGVKEVEEALSKPDQETQYFPPINIINIHKMENSQIQQGNIDSTQTGSFHLSNKEDISSFIELLKAKIPELQLNDEDKSEINAEISTVKAQLLSSRPKRGILKECLGSIKKILENASGVIIAKKLLEHIPKLLATL